MLLYHEESQFVQETWNRAYSADAVVWKHGIARQTTDHSAGFDCQDLSIGPQSEIHRFLRIYHADNSAARPGTDQGHHHEEC